MGRRKDSRVRHIAGAALALAVLSGASAAPAQEAQALPSTLIADRVSIDANGVLVASGNVEAMQGTYHLKASQITYDPNSETLDIAGPIILQDGPNSVVLADSAQLSTDLREGLLDSARVVLDQQLQISAVELHRVSGRYNQLYNTVASSCEVCAKRPIPVWQIRSKRVVHDQEEKQIYFDHAFFEVLGVPVFYAPQLRLPDPTLERARGFLTPSIRNTSDLGTGIKLPYFIPLGRSKDVTLTPYVSAGAGYTQTLELRYRQAFRRGYFEMNGAVSNDSLLEDELRAYVVGNGYFSLPRDFFLSFDIEKASDEDYLNDYDYNSGKDRLDSAVAVQRIRKDKLFKAEVIFYESLRSEDNNEYQPYRVTDINFDRRLVPAQIGGILNLGFDLHGHQRRSEEDVLGRDVARLSGTVDWKRNWVGPAGLLFGTELGSFLDHTEVSHDSNFDSSVTEFAPYGVAEMRWPLIRQGSRATHVIEPVMQLVWSRENDEDTPTDESTQLEFDSGNLFSLSRFPAADEREEGLRANLGISWTRSDPTGWSMRWTFGRILRSEDLGQFDGYGIFEGTKSDWLGEVLFDLPNRLSIANRATFDDDLAFSRNELRLDWDRDNFDIGTSFIWLEDNITESRYYETQEWSIEADWDVNDRLSTTLDWRYDMTLDRAASTEIGLEYRTECVDYDFAFEQSYSDYDQTSPDTSFTFQVNLAGIGNTGKGRTRPVRLGCRG
ncbi:LPS-assembly protein LptD [Aliiruegeria sabulilitoris]|uniref:LPS-assembly protein LptD n=1 Tax=Aliiruegeria sabulilitoris TaxID=1510458 RepID=UPI000834D5EF|nr:LPS assembly protein LptD [Aliiruegeria sabulilitoris]NDR54960.1 LPS-assembly protein LptD [Pseudoruegeria sp. M32A2M]